MILSSTAMIMRDVNETRVEKRVMNLQAVEDEEV